MFLSGSGDWGCLQESGFPPDQRATVKACPDDHSAGLRAFFWGFMLLWVVRTLTQLVECRGGGGTLSSTVIAQLAETLCFACDIKKKKFML